jgi:hypothetical protein
MSWTAWALLILVVGLLIRGFLIEVAYQRCRSRLTSEESANNYLANECTILTTAVNELRSKYNAAINYNKMWYEGYEHNLRDKQRVQQRADQWQACCVLCRARCLKLEMKLRAALESYTQLT